MRHCKSNNWLKRYRFKTATITVVDIIKFYTPSTHTHYHSSAEPYWLADGGDLVWNVVLPTARNGSERKNLSNL